MSFPELGHLRLSPQHNVFAIFKRDDPDQPITFLDRRETSEAQEYARLFAAAPDLYEALKLARFELDLINNEGPSAPYNAVIKKITSALEKAVE